jgi:hypothetical protein
MSGSLLLVTCLLVAQAPAEDPLQTTVRHLVRQLDAPRLVERDAAEAKLLGLGPDVVRLLPAVTERTPAEVRQRLQRVRQKLERMVARSAGSPSLVTLHARGEPLSQVLAAIRRQTGNKIVDARPQAGTPPGDPPVSVDFENTPFWQALDQILDQAGLTVYPYGEADAISLVAGPKGPPSRVQRGIYCGPFRLEPIRVLAERDLRQPANQSLRLTLEAVWEPRLKPINLKLPLASLQLTDGRGNPLEVDNRRAELDIPLTPGVTAAELTLPLVLPPRDVQQIARLHGVFSALLPGKVETFRFDRLTAAASAEKRIANTTVVLERVRKNEAAWEVRILVRFDQAAGALESHRGWILQNEAYLEGPDGKPIPYGTMETTRQTDNEIGIAYLFNLDAPPDNLAFVYKSPGAILTTSFDFTIRGIALP